MNEDLLPVVCGNGVHSCLNRHVVTITINVNGDITLADGSDPFVPWFRG